MIAIIGSVIFGIMAVISVLLIAGLPLGELTMGGQHRVLPPKMRVFAAVSIVLQVFAALILLQKGGIIAEWFGGTATTVICFIFAVYFTLNTFMNAFSKSKKERFIMTPLAALVAVAFWLTAFGIII